MLKYNKSDKRFEVPYDFEFRCEGIADLIAQDFLRERKNPRSMVSIRNETHIPNNSDLTYIVDGEVFDFEVKSARVATNSFNRNGRFSWTEKQYTALCQPNKAYIFVGKTNESIQWIIIARLDIKEAIRRDLLQFTRKGKTDKMLNVDTEFTNGNLKNRRGKIAMKINILRKYTKIEIDKIVVRFSEQKLEMGTF